MGSPSSPVPAPRLPVPLTEEDAKAIWEWLKEVPPDVVADATQRLRRIAENHPSLHDD